MTRRFPVSQTKHTSWRMYRYTNSDRFHKQIDRQSYTETGYSNVDYGRTESLLRTSTRPMLNLLLLLHAYV